MSLDELFDEPSRRRLRLRRGRERVIANRHPWVFAGAIAEESGPEAAAIADLVDEKGERLASGFYSARSQIRLRALTFGEEALTPGVVRARIAMAIARRRDLTSDATNAVRLVNAEGDDLSGLIADRYADMVVIEITNRGLEKVRPLVLEAIRGQVQPRGIYCKNDLPARSLEGLPQECEWLGEGEPLAEVRENGLAFLVDPREGQKTGFFLDQRENRRMAMSVAARKKTLNLFSYSGAFGVYAAAGGASHVENVDVSARAIDLARANHERNGTGGVASCIVADAFAYVRERASSGERFDLVICDPPAFARSRGEVDRAARGYKDINLHAMRLAAPGATMLTFSCSGHMSLDLFQKVIFAAALDAGRRVSFVRRLTAGPDHPVSLYCPEGEYLKGFMLHIT
ncbi:MAG TPA: class I SAM-dependent rRNA methyltransferase [Thermoanaerobaculia bacterium]|nr:class I SAM-dependent rRNA methyltransferase [Thermoanaerobaculia bacterium]